MNRYFLFGMCLIFSAVHAWAQEIPLFSAGVTASPPRVGRYAQPLSSLVLTPPPLPALRVPLPTQTKPPSPEPPPVIVEPVITPPPPVAKPVVQPKPVVKPAPRPVLATTRNVRDFSIAGFELGMTPDETVRSVAQSGFSMTQAQMGIPRFKTAYYEHECRIANVHTPRANKECILNLAKATGDYFVESMTFAKPATREYVQVLFTSNATGNEAYKIYYENRGDNSLNFSPVNATKKQRRKEAFWNNVFEQYGYPDDAKAIVWGDPKNVYMKVYMQGSAFNGFIELEDKKLGDADYFETEDAVKETSYRYPFSFANY